MILDSLTRVMPNEALICRVMKIVSSHILNHSGRYRKHDWQNSSYGSCT